mmetsp:Transcript_15504/g.17356  ORF Transcript_15504/g.17356 Transcript_15504/m.17356 type:complete len:141 (-) Transcript_15504:133-555(-)
MRFRAAGKAIISQKKAHKAIKSIVPSDYPGEDVQKMVKDLKVKIKALEEGNHAYDEDVTLIVAQNLAIAGGAKNLAYNTKLRKMIEKLILKLPQISHLSNANKTIELKKIGLSYTNVLDAAESAYLKQVVAGNLIWPPQC